VRVAYVVELSINTTNPVIAAAFKLDPLISVNKLQGLLRKCCPRFSFRQKNIHRSLYSTYNFPTLDTKVLDFSARCHGHRHIKLGVIMNLVGNEEFL
jgi:hypothetical protein